MDAKTLYQKVELASWTGPGSLTGPERVLVERFLNPNGKTLEGGTGGGRVLLALRDRGFASLTGFDFVPEMIDAARQLDPARAIRFEVQDATNLNYANDEFDQIVYFGQIFSLIGDDAARLAAFREAFRVLKPGGVALAS